MAFTERFQPPTSSIKVPSGSSDLLQRSLHRIKSPTNSTSQRSTTYGSYTQRFTQRYQERKQHQQQIRDESEEKRDPVASKREVCYETLVCDYDQSVTVLYELLENSKWDEARKRCRTHPDEVRTWIVRREKNRSQIRWKLLPLHASIIFQSPTHLIASIIESYPEASEAKDDQGMLPLHLAFRHKHDDEDLMELLLQAYPEAIFARDARRRLPVDHGRDAKYSSKAMQLFAEAAMIANTRNTSDSHTATTAMMTSALSESERQRIESKYEVKLAAMKQTYDKEIDNMKKKLEDRVKELADQKAYEITKVLQAFETEKTSITQKHEEKMRDLEKQLATENNKDRTRAEQLQSEIEHLQSELQREQSFRQRVATDFSELQMFTQDLRDQLEQISRDQVEIQNAAKDQKKAVENARRRRSHLLKSLIEQEEEFEMNDIVSGKHIFDVASRARCSIEEVRKGLPQKHPVSPRHLSPTSRYEYANPHRPVSSYSQYVTTPNKSRDRHLPSPVLHTTEQDNTLSRLDVERLGSFTVERRESNRVDMLPRMNSTDAEYQQHRSSSPRRRKISLAVETDFHHPTATDDLRHHALGDEISAITELSPY